MQYQIINPINKNYSPIEQVLTNRGISIKDVQHYLNTSIEDNISATQLDNIHEAAQIIVKHILDPNAHIHVQVDCDCDGLTSAALLLNYIYVCFPSAINKFSYSQHQGKQHGIDLVAIPSNTTLVIAPDSSSNEYDIHKTLRDKGLDVVVLDHHEAERISEYACVVNNQLCDYPTKSLSGVGIVYKLCQYIDNMLPEGSYADSFLDLVAVGLDWLG